MSADGQLFVWICSSLMCFAVGFVLGYAMGVERCSRTLSRIARGER